MKEFYSPVVSNQASCKNCYDCVNVCPADAIRHTGTGLNFDRIGCAGYSLKEGECLECITVCKPGAISMRIFVKDGDGEPVRKT